ncbi:MAG: hypothetical protein RBU45_26125, partial [Myxococcota bacterium]|nr:hypothetical protein [Myxococcota bacterium]
MAEQRTAFGCSRVSESRPAVGQVLAVCLFLGGLAACSGEEQRPAEDPPVSCVSGRETGCTCADGRLGSQVCASDGRSWSSCRCEGAEGEGEGAEGE